MALVLADCVQSCFKCGVEKPLSSFPKHPTGKFGVNTTCKTCRNIYRNVYYEANKEKERARDANWSKNNLHKKREYRAKRRAVLLKATPLWANTNAIKRIYAEADFLSKATGIKYEVDHIIPLQGKNVCGLHVVNNLQVIQMVHNRQKAIRYEE
jgi:hypothetical protein